MCSLWKKLEERHSLAESPENNESLSQMRPVVQSQGASQGSSAGWGRAAVKGPAQYWILTEVLKCVLGQVTCFPSLHVHLCKMKNKLLHQGTCL